MKTKSKYLPVLNAKTFAFTFMIILITLFLYISNESIHAESIVKANGETEITIVEQNTPKDITKYQYNENTDTSLDTIIKTEYENNKIVNCYCVYCSKSVVKGCAQSIGCFDSFNENKLFFLQLSAERLEK